MDEYKFTMPNKACNFSGPHPTHVWQEHKETYTTRWRCLGVDASLADPNETWPVDGVPTTMGGHAIPMLRRDDCQDPTPHASHTWVVEGESEKETVFCLGIDASGRRPDAMSSKPDEELQDFPPLHSHVGDGKWHINCEACNSDDVREDFMRCPTCESPDPKQHPAISGGGEVTHICPDPFHGDVRVSVDPGKTTGTAVQRWADEAMFKAEPLDAAEGPRVYLLWMTPDPLGAIAAACKMYKGEVVRDLSTVTDAERLEYFEQVQKTKLKAPFEFVKFHFLIEGVTRSFTHQMVRQRTAAYAQESLRFAVKEDMPVGLPPSLAGTDDYWAADDMPSVPQTNEEHMRAIWENAKEYNQNVYNELVNMGMPAEDARGLLPHNVLTRLHYTTDLRALLDHAGNRLCTQAQFEWRLVFAKIIEAIRGAECSLRIDANGMDNAYMTNNLLGAFRPVCYATGKCEFKAKFDRHCSIRERVDQNEQIGRSSSEWDKPLDDPNGIGGNQIQAIKPGEWLLDSGAARKKKR